MIAVAIKASRIKAVGGIILLGGILFLITLAFGALIISRNPLLPSDSERIVFIEEHGFSVTSEPISVETVIPSEWNDTYTQYNLLQNEQGFDLSGYKGETAVRYIFPAEKDNTEYEVTLILLGDRIIGADAYSYDTGEMIGVLTA